VKRGRARNDAARSVWNYGVESSKFINLIPVQRANKLEEGPLEDGAPPIY